MSEVPLVRDVFAIYLSKESVLRSWSDATLRCYGAAGRMLLTFNRSLRIDGLGRREMEELYLSFARRELSNRSIKYYFTLLSTFLRWAEREGYPVDGSWKDFKPRLKQAPKAVVWLNPDELGALMRLPRRGWTVAKRAVADYFLLSCFTGLRASDLKRLRWCDVRDGSIRIVTSKTAASITVELNRFSREIIGRQKGRDGESGFLMPRADLAAANGVLKQIALEAGLTAPVASVTYRSGGKRIEPGASEMAGNLDALWQTHFHLQRSRIGYQPSCGDALDRPQELRFSQALHRHQRCRKSHGDGPLRQSVKKLTIWK